MSNVVVVGHGYVGLPLAMRAAEVGHKVVGYDIDASRVKQLETGDPTSRTCPASQLARPCWTAARFTPSAEARSCAGFDVAVITVPTPLREGAAGPDLHRVGLPHARPVPAPRRDRGPRVDDVAGHDRRRWSALILEDGSGLIAGVDFHLGYSPERIDPGNTTWTWSTRRRSSPASTPASLDGGAGVLRRTRREDRGGRLARGGRAGQAAREHVPARQHRAGQRAGDVRPRARHRHLGGDRRRVDQAVRVHAVHARARASAGTACRSTLRTCPGGSSARSGQTFRFVELANDINNHMPDYVVRRLMLALNKRGQRGQRLADPAARARLQEEHRRRAGVAGRPGRPAAGRAGRRRAWPPTRTWARSGLIGTQHRAGRADRGGDRQGRRRRAAHRPRRVRPSRRSPRTPAMPWTAGTC